MLLKYGKYISEMTADEVENIFILNADEVPTHYRIPTLEEIFKLLKGKAYINVDKFWTDVEGISGAIRRAGVEKQVLVKTCGDEESLCAVEKYASDMMFMPMVRREDTTTESLLKRNIKFIGNEILFESEQDEVIRDGYIEKLHKKGRLVWANAIVYNEKEVISAGHTDDSAFEKDMEYGWGWLADKNIDFIQPDWLSAMREYILMRENGYARVRM